MKQKYPFNGSNQSVDGGKCQLSPGAYSSGGRRQLYRSVIAAVSGSLFCVATGEHAAAQTFDATAQMPGQMFTETAQSSPPTLSGSLELEPVAQWAAQSLEPAGASLICSDLQGSSIDVDNSALWHPAERLELFSRQGSPKNADNSPVVSAAPAANAAPPAASTAVPPTDAAVPPAAVAVPGISADANGTPTLALPGLPIQQPTVYKNELSASADVMYGIGTITVPIGYGLKASSPPGASFPVDAITADRSTVYVGGTISYSFGRSWYLDFSGEDGRSTGSTGISIPGLGGPPIPATFDVEDTWYRIYLRYNFQNFLAGTRFRAYLRGGATLVKATLTTSNESLPGSHIGAGDFYTENDNTFDAWGNVGFGLTYSVYSTIRLKVGLQLEGEGFAGNRSQDIDEEFVPDHLTGKTTINNTVYGAIGRLTLHADYRLGQSGRWKLTGDVGITTINSFVTYPDFGTKAELLYGPYAKVGASFVF